MNELFSIRRTSDAFNGRIIWSQDQIDYITNHYNEFHSTTTLSKLFGVSTQAIRGLLRKQGIKVLSISELQTLDFPRNSNYFHIIDTPAKAYWLGFLYADGYISPSHEIRIGLEKEDENHLKKFLTAIDATNHTIKYSQKYGDNKIYYTAYCSLRDKTLVQDLADKGCVNNKSLILTFPKDKVPSNLWSHFIRGYFDGDGSIHYTQCGQARHPNYRISFTGTEDMLVNIRHILQKDNLALAYHTNYCVLQICGNKQLESVLTFIYKDSSPEMELDRKKIIYNNFLLQRVGGEPSHDGCE